MGKRWAILLFLSPCLAPAAELFGPEAGVVPYGMGRAYSAIADDWLALHYNPAGLALVNKVDFQIFDLRLGSTRDVVNSYENVKDLSADSDNLAVSMNNYLGKHVMAELSNHTQITVPHFALGLSYQVHANIDMQNSAYPQTLMRYTKDLAFHAGGAVAIGKRKDLRMGLAFRFITRKGGIKSVGIAEIVGSSDAIVELFDASGSGLGSTFGLQYRLPTPGRAEVTTSFVWHDIGQTSFGGRTTVDRPSRIPANMVAGLGLRLPIGGKKNRRLERRYGPSRSTSHLTFAFDYSHLNYSVDEEHLPKHIHLGMNLDLPLLALQLGLNQTSMTAGFSFDVGVLRVNAATYGEELGSYGGQRRDRRYLLSVGSSLAFKGF